jgi:hypothetical protein
MLMNFVVQVRLCSIVDLSDDQSLTFRYSVVSLRAKVDRIQLWTRSKTDIERLNGIAKKMISLLGVSEADNVGLEFQVSLPYLLPYFIFFRSFLIHLSHHSITAKTTPHQTNSSP